MASDEVREALRRAARQQQFLEVVGRDEAEARFRRHLTLAPLGRETVPLARAPGRVLCQDVVAGVDVPAFDRSSVDGFAVRAADLAGASDEAPRRLRLNPELLTPGVVPRVAVEPGTATVLATGGMLPRGADAVVMVEYTEPREEGGDLLVEVRRPVAPGDSVAAAGSDIARGETVLRAGQLLGSREVGSLAAIGLGEVAVWRRPRVAILSTGDEIVAPGQTLPPGGVYDSNAAILAAAVEELGCTPVPLGIAPDDEAALSARLAEGLAHDAVLLSGGTSKGSGDVAARVVGRLSDPGLVVHGVALKPGKPLCLAVTGGKPVVILPGFPTSAIFTFHEFVAPVLRAFAGLPPERRETVPAILSTRVASQRGRTEYVMVSLVERPGGGLVAHPTGKGSGAVTAFGQADGFFAVKAHAEALAAGTPVEVTAIGAGHRPADLVVMGSHCVGLDVLVGRLTREGLSVKVINVGSMGGLAAARRGECDVAGVHLMDPGSGEYNRPFLTEALELVPGYRREQGLVFRPGDARFEGRSAGEAAALAAASPGCIMVNRNPGSGTRVLVDRLLGEARPAGYTSQARTHNAVAAAVAQGRADWGVAIRPVAAAYRLGFLPLQDEHYDFVVPKDRLGRDPVKRFVALLGDPEVREALVRLGFEP
ncbi:MAG TPA: molybdopterin biosynthesis protein [Anaeromyxobacteraceae bacterium]|nr:molybdopterin biosynthesis protein [Anaeromyxobacteraceae bacterium]